MGLEMTEYLKFYKFNSRGTPNLVSKRDITRKGFSVYTSTDEWDFYLNTKDEDEWKLSTSNYNSYKFIGNKQYVIILKDGEFHPIEISKRNSVKAIPITIELIDRFVAKYLKEKLDHISLTKTFLQSGLNGIFKEIISLFENNEM